MAIYRTGTASLAANGVVIGVGTKWQDKLSLIRVGATIMFPTVVGAIGTISAIVSDTELRVMTTNGSVVPAGSQYVILLHDSITVDGLAQDVAETLRYYQSKETEVADAIDFFKTFDWEQFKVVADKVTADAAAANASKNAAAAYQTAAAGSATAAKTSETNAEASETAANASKLAAAASQVAAKTSETNAKTSETNSKTSENNANTSKIAAAASQVAALASQNAAKTSETNAKASENAAKTSETNAKASEAASLASKNAASASQTAAANSAAAALASQNAAKTSETNAKGYADSINPALLLAKSQNLADVANKETARKNLMVPYLDSATIAAGVNIDTINGIGKTGIYHQSSSESATTANGYPEQVAGTLFVYSANANGGLHTTQEYIPYNNQGVTYRRQYNLVSGSWVWSAWEKFLSTESFKTTNPVFGPVLDLTGSGLSMRLGVGTNDTYIRNTQANKYLQLTNDGGIKFDNADLLYSGYQSSGDVSLDVNRLRIGCQGDNYTGINLQATKGGTSQIMTLSFYNKDGSRQGFIGKSDTGSTMAMWNDGPGNRILLHTDGDASVVTKGNCGSFITEAGNIRIRRSGLRSLSLDVASNSAQRDMIISAWGNGAGRASVMEGKLDNGYLWYAQQNSDGSKVFNVSGAMEATAFNQTSDRSKKDNIEVISDATVKLRMMNGYTYNLKSDGMPYAGVIAQEVQEALPEAFSGLFEYIDADGVNPDGTPLQLEDRSYMVDYSGITGLLVQVGRETDDRVTKLEKEIEELKEIILSLSNK